MNRESGISLIEILVAVLVLSIGLLGIAGLQTAALTANSTSYQYTQASFLVESMAESMRANASGVTAGNYSLNPATAPGGSSVNCISSTCTPANQALWDEGVFYSAVTGASNSSGAPVLAAQNSAGTAITALPSGAASVSCSSNIATTGICLITVYWDPGRTGSTATSTTTCSGTTTSNPSGLRCFQLAFRP